jgi:hypothetical protein
MTANIIRLISILLVGFVLLFGNIQQINFLSLQNRKAIILAKDKTDLELKKETILQQNLAKFSVEIDKKIAKNEIQQTIIGLNKNISNLENLINNQKLLKNTNNTVIIAR